MLVITSDFIKRISVDSKRYRKIRQILEMYIQSVIHLALKLLGISGVSPVKHSEFSNILTVFYFATFIVSYAINLVNLFYIDDLNLRINNLEGFVSITHVGYKIETYPLKIILS